MHRHVWAAKMDRTVVKAGGQHFSGYCCAASGSSAHGRLMTGARTWSLEARLDALPTPPVGDHATSGSGDGAE
jgi:hypothetical protein